MSKSKSILGADTTTIDIRESKKKIRTADSYYSILTEGPLSGRPAYFIELDNSNKKQKKISFKKLHKKIDEECASHMVVASGKDAMNPKIVDLIMRMGMTLYVKSNGNENIDHFPFAEGTVFVAVEISTKTIDPVIADKAFSFNYTISKHTPISKDGLPKGLFRPVNMLRVTLTPELAGDTAFVVDLCKKYGFYLNIPYNHFIGIR